MMASPYLRAQCTISAPISIPDNDCVTIAFQVSGLVNGNLSDPNQGICGVEIEFTHEYLGDLTLALVSPSGTTVDLIGLPTTATLPTNLTTWDIGFIPCAQSAMPDAGFSDAWSNDQPWAALTMYGGDYHPFSGCLEDFDSGSANGTWQIFICDHDINQLGTIQSINLIFCDPTGLACLECNANAGTLSPGNVELCAGQNIQSGSLSIDFGGNSPDMSTYGYYYLLVLGNTILQSGSSFSANPPPGQYRICALSYKLDDLATVDALIASGDFDILEQSIQSGVFCGDLADNCVDVVVFDQPDTTHVNTNLCAGETFTYNGQNYQSTGVFYQVKDGPGMCDTIVEIRIAPRPLNVTIDPPGLLTCAGGEVTLSSNASGSMGALMYNWTTSSGNIVSSPFTSSIQVNQPSAYQVSVTDGLCSGVAGAQVQADLGFPQIVLSGGTITCLNTAVDLHPIYVPANGTIGWTGPAGFTSNMANINVTVPGTYFFTVTNQQGCSTTRPVDVLVDTMTFDFDIIIRQKDCAQQKAEIASSYETSLIQSWNWSGLMVQ